MIMRGGNDEAAQVISDLEGRIKNLDQEKLVMGLRQVKLEKELESLKRKRRDSPSPPPAQSASKLRILITQGRNGISHTNGIFSFSLLSSPT
jgi:hypothetical protein